MAHAKEKQEQELTVAELVVLLLAESQSLAVLIESKPAKDYPHGSLDFAARVVIEDDGTEKFCVIKSD